MFRSRASMIALMCAALVPPFAAQQTESGVEFTRKLVAAAVERTNHTVRYDPAYVRIPYPGGDVPAETGVCTDEIVRIYRAVSIDLQKLVHEDMSRRFSLYPKKWGRKKPDPNIDHRRVPNLATFFELNGKKLPITQNDADYKPGDIVAWDLGGDVPHIGMVVDRQRVPGRYMIEHNIGAGPKIEDVLFAWNITGHFRYLGPHQPAEQAGRYLCAPAASVSTFQSSFASFAVQTFLAQTDTHARDSRLATTYHFNRPTS